MSSLGLGFMLGDVTRQLRRTVQQRIQGLELTFDQMRVLVHISRNEGIRQVDLSGLLEVQPITLVHQIDLLAKKELVERRADPTDRRAYRLFLTQAAAPHLSAIEQIGEAIQTEMLRGLDKQQIASLISSLSAIHNNLASH